MNEQLLMSLNVFPRLPKLAIKPWISSSPTGLVLKNAFVVDPSSSRILEGPQDVTIQQGKIVSVLPSLSAKSHAQREKEELHEVDLAGAFLCP